MSSMDEKCIDASIQASDRLPSGSPVSAVAMHSRRQHCMHEMAGIALQPLTSAALAPGMFVPTEEGSAASGVAAVTGITLHDKHPVTRGVYTPRRGSSAISCTGSGRPGPDGVGE